MKKKLHVSYSKYKELIRFDESNFSRKCMVHNLPFSEKNMLKYNCDIYDCKASKIYLEILSKNITELMKSHYILENNQLKKIHL